jgi:hypothetical protein
MQKLVITIFSFALALQLSAQTFQPNHTFNIELGLPKGFTNQPFNRYMQGLLDGQLYYQYAFKNHLIVGAGVRFAYFGISEFKVPKKVYGGFYSGGAFLKIGWEKFFTEQFGMELSLKVGYTQNYFKTDRNDSLGTNPIMVKASYVAPTVGLILKVDEASSFRFFVSYGIQGMGFSPQRLGLQTNDGFDPSNFSSNISFLTAGFGFTHYFGFKSTDEGFVEEPE